MLMSLKRLARTVVGFAPTAFLFVIPLASALPAAANCAGGVFTKSHVWDDNDSNLMLSVGDVLHYTIVFCDGGVGDRMCSFRDVLPQELLLDVPSLACTPDPGSAPPGICQEDPPGSGTVLVNYRPNPIDAGTCVTVTFDATVQRPPTNDVCNQGQNVNVPAHQSNLDCQQIVAAPDLQIVKTALMPATPPGGPAPFEILVRNNGAAALASGLVNDTLRSCFERLGAAGLPCGPEVSCAGAGCAGSTCTYTAAGFDFAGFNLAAADGVSGGPDEIIITVTAVAGPTAGLCDNIAETSDPNSPSLISTAPINITNQADLQITKTAQTSEVAPGGQAAFDIVVTNIGGGALTGGRVDDTLRSCWLPLGVDGMPCAPGVVTCAGTGCAGATCVYANGGGFVFSGFNLAPSNGAPGGDDEIVITVIATAGPTPEPACENNADTSDPDSPLLSASDSVAISVDPNLLLTKNAGSATVPAGSPVVFDITMENNGGGPLVGGSLTDVLDPCFVPLGTNGAPCDPLVVQCVGAACATSVCVYSNGGLGFTVTGIDLTAPDGSPGGDDEVRFNVTVVAGPNAGACSNNAQTSDPDQPSIADGASVMITLTAQPDLELTKTALQPTVAPGGTVDFDIVVHNFGAAMMTGAQVVDTMDPCFEPLGVDGVACDPGVVQCTGNACAAAMCIYSNGGLGFTYSGLDLAADDATPGGADEVLITVTATAGPTIGSCVNRAETSDPSSPSVTDSDSVDIVVATGCALMDGDQTFTPSTPPTASLYSNACGAGDPRLANVNTATPVFGSDLGDVYAGTGGTLRFYQLDCPCVDKIGFIKNVGSGLVQYVNVP